MPFAPSSRSRRPRAAPNPSSDRPRIVRRATRAARPSESDPRPAASPPPAGSPPIRSRQREPPQLAIAFPPLDDDDVVMMTRPVFGERRQVAIAAMPMRRRPAAIEPLEKQLIRARAIRREQQRQAVGRPHRIGFVGRLRGEPRQRFARRDRRSRCRRCRSPGRGARWRDADCPARARGSRRGLRSRAAVPPAGRRDPARRSACAAPDATTRRACRCTDAENTPARRSSRNASVFATSALSPASSSRDGLDRLRDQTALARDARDAARRAARRCCWPASRRRGGSSRLSSEATKIAPPRAASAESEIQEPPPVRQKLRPAMTVLPRAGFNRCHGP